MVNLFDIKVLLRPRTWRTLIETAEPKIRFFLINCLLSNQRVVITNITPEISSLFLMTLHQLKNNKFDLA